MASQNKQVESMLEPWLELSNKVVMVTGASSSLGWEFCLVLAKAVCRIIAPARRIDRLKTLCDEINGTAKPSQDQPVAVALELDISSTEPIIKDRVKMAWDVFGRIDVLINNAGIRGRVHAPFDLIQKNWFEKVVEKTTPLGTFGTTNPAMTSVIRYLIHDSSQYVTGNVFIVDAGGTLVAVPIFSSL